VSARCKRLLDRASRLLDCRAIYLYAGTPDEAKTCFLKPTLRAPTDFHEALCSPAAANCSSSEAMAATRVEDLRCRDPARLLASTSKRTR
jgi:hypothetical protein